MRPIQKLAGQTLIYGMGTIVPRLLNYLLLTPFYTRIFLRGEYGVITELYAYVAFLMVLLTYGMETAFFRYAESEEDSHTVYATSLFSLLTTSLVFIGFVILFTQPIASLIHYGSNKEYITYFAFIVGIDAFTAIPFARLRQQQKAFRFALIKIINVIVNIVFNLLFFVVFPHIIAKNTDSFIQHWYNPDIGVGYAFIANLIASMVTLLLLYPEIFHIKPDFKFSILKKMLKYSLPLLVVGLAGMVNEVSDKILLKYLVAIPEGVIDRMAYAMEQVGIYGANFKMAVLMTLFIQMFRYAAEPFFFAQAREKNPAGVYADVMKYFVIFCLFIFLTVTMYMDVFKYFIGPDFRSGLHIVPIILLANLFLGVFYNLSVWYKLTDKTRFGAYMAIMGAAITIVMNIVLVPLIGYHGSAWGHFTCYFTMMVVSYFIGRKYYPVKYDIKRILLYILLAICLFFIAQWIYIPGLMIRMLVNSSYILVFILVLFFVERRKLPGIFNK